MQSCLSRNTFKHSSTPDCSMAPQKQPSCLTQNEDEDHCQKVTELTRGTAVYSALSLFAWTSCSTEFTEEENMLDSLSCVSESAFVYGPSFHCSQLEVQSSPLLPLCGCGQENNLLLLQCFLSQEQPITNTPPPKINCFTVSGQKIHQSHMDCGLC